MRKLRLNLDQLTVDSFDTSVAAAKKGTVVGEEQCTCPTNCHTYCDTCPGCPTCNDTECNQATCDSCVNTCYPCGTDYGHTCDYSQSRDPYNCQCCPL